MNGEVDAVPASHGDGRERMNGTGRVGRSARNPAAIPSLTCFSALTVLLNCVGVVPDVLEVQVGAV